MGFADLLTVTIVFWALAMPVGLLALAAVQTEDPRDAWFAGLAAPGIGLILYGGLTSAIVLVTGRWSPVTMWTAWGVAVGLGLVAAGGHLRLNRRLLGGALLSAALVVCAAALIMAPVRSFPASPDYDGTADGYFAAIVKLGGTFPRFSPLGGDDFIEVTVPPAPVILGAFASDVTGVVVSRVQMAQAATAWAMYWLAVPFAAYAVFRTTSFPLLGPILAALFSYTLSLRWTYYDGSNTRLLGVLGLLTATAMYLRYLEGHRRSAVWAGLLLGCTSFFHSRYFIVGMLTIGVFAVFQAAMSLRRRDYSRLRTEFAGAVMVAAIGMALTLLMIAPDLTGLMRTEQHAHWSRPVQPFVQRLDVIARFQGSAVYFSTLAAAVLLLLWCRDRRPALACACTAILVQTALSFDAAFLVAPMLRVYLDGPTLVLSGFADARPIVLAAAALVPAGVFAAKGTQWRRAAGAGLAITLGATAVATARAPEIPAMYTYLTPGDVQALQWIRSETPVEGTLILNYPWDDLPDTILAAHYGMPAPRASINFETLWVAAVAERRAVFHWGNRLLHQGIWNIVRAASPDLPESLEKLSFAYLNPCAPGTYQTLREAGVTHVWVPPLLHVVLGPALDSCAYLKPVFRAEPPFEGYYGRPESGFRPADPRRGAAVFAVVDPP